MQKRTFADKVRSVVAKIPRGKTMTYKQVATKAGSPGGSRAVGNIIAKNQDKDIPCHRVIKSDGSIGKYNGLQGDKAELLKKEGAL